MRAEILERDTDLALDLLMGRGREVDAAGLRQRLEPRSDVDAVAVDIGVVDHDVAEVYADAIVEPFVGGQAGIARGHTLLDLDRAPHGVDHARELGQHAVARRLDEAASVLGDFRADHFTIVRLEGGQRPFLVGAHQPRIAGNVGRQDRGQSALDALLDQGYLPYMRMSGECMFRRAGKSIASCS